MSCRRPLRFALCVVLCAVAVLGASAMGGGRSSAGQPEAVAAATPSLEVIGQLGGASWAVAASGNRAYLGVGPRVLAFDVTDPAHPALLGRSAPLGGIIADMQLVGHYLYVAASEAGLQILDVANPASPALVGQIEIGGHPYVTSELVVSGSRAYVVAGYVHSRTEDRGMMMIVDISDPARPTTLGQYSNPGFFVNGIFVSGNCVYLTWMYGLSILDVSDAANVQGVSYLDTGDDEPFGVYVQAGYAYLAASDLVVVVDVRDIENPALVTTIPVTGEDITGSGGYLYLAGDQFRVVDVATPAAPVVAASIAVSGQAIALAGNAAYLASGGLRVVSVANPRAPTAIGSYRGLGATHTLALSGNYALVLANGLHIVDVSAPSAPRSLGALDVGASAIAVTGRYAYLAAGGDGLKVVSFSDAAHPALVRTIDTPGSAVAVQVEGSRLYLGDSEGGLRIYDISSPGAPQELSTLDIPTTHLQPAGDYVYAALPYWEEGYERRSSTLYAVHVADAAHPAVVGSTTVDSGVEDMDLAGGRLLLLHNQVYGGYEGPYGELSVWDLSEPASPNKTTTFVFEPLGPSGYTFAGAYRLDVSEDYAYVALKYYWDKGYALSGEAVLALDISTVTDPVQIDEWRVNVPADRVNDLQTAGNTVYVADGDAGLSVLRHEEIEEPTPTPTLAATPTPAPACQVIPVSCDTYISSWYPQQNYAAGPYLALRQGNVAAPMLKFDGGALPAAASISKATLNLHVRYRTNAASLLARVYGVRRPWACDEVTWQRASDAAAWGAPGCGDTATDRDPTPAAEMLLDAENRWYSLDVTDLVRRWASDPSSNQGLILVGEGGVSVQYGLSATEADDPGFAPRLVVCAAQPTPTPTRTPGPTLPPRVRLPLIRRQPTS